ncbi:hypothetical protein, partial [Poseidonibacter antarcticus]|uniref:hypothetical protein n=1 Tax=Poseidonibacter antarcticus TaxID=2478538 RepID=UPI00196981E5
MGFSLASEKRGKPKNENGNWGFNLGEHKPFSEKHPWVLWGKNDLYKPPKRDSLSPSHCATQKRAPSYGKMQEIGKK